MNKEKQIEEMAKQIYGNLGLTMPTARNVAKYLTKKKGYRKASEVALESVDDFQRALRHIFLNMCCANDYNTLNLLQIDSAIESLYDTFIAELKKKYTEDK